MAKKQPKPLPELSWLEPRLRISRILTLLALAALALLLVVWNAYFADLHGARTWLITSIELLPLALIAPGVLLGTARGHAWACFVVNLYFIKGILASIDPNRAWLGYTETVLSVLLFCSALMYTRWRFQYDRKLAGET
ncbi:MAG TPA: DUF2069 domain-containing protein [Thiopseudomonas sp.]|nr:DUF2069 domain-containing protein [Thiopseudomonas sp.]